MIFLHKPLHFSSCEILQENSNNENENREIYY